SAFRAIARLDCGLANTFAAIQINGPIRHSHRNSRELFNRCKPLKTIIRRLLSGSSGAVVECFVWGDPVTVWIRVESGVTDYWTCLPRMLSFNSGSVTSGAASAV